MMSHGALLASPLAALAVQTPTSAERSGGAPPRLPALDALRGLAALAVLLYHYTVHYVGHFAPALHPFFVFSRGNLGVDLFFCISGFVISMTLERCATWQEFALRRVARIYPAYLAALVFTYAVYGYSELPKFHYPWSDFLMNLTMLQELFGYSHIDGVYWTLQVELAFYVIIATLHFSGALARRNTVCLSWLLLSAGYSWMQRAAPTTAGHLVGELLILARAPLFIIGMVAFGFYRRQRVDRDGLALVALCVACQLVNWLLFAGLAAITGFALLMLAPRLQQRHVGAMPLFLGNISFTLYLVHQHFGYMVIHEVLQRSGSLELGIGAAAAASILVATGITYAIERPAQRRLLKALRRPTPQGQGVNPASTHE